MKKLSCIFLASIMVCGLCACGKQTQNDTSNSSLESSEPVVHQKTLVNYHSPDSIKERGELIVGARSETYEFFKDKQNADAGYVVNMSRAIAEDIGSNVKVKYVTNTPEELLNALKNGDVDVVICSLGSSPEIEEKFTLSESYWPWEADGTSLFVLDKNTGSYKVANDFSKSKIAVVSDTIQEEIIKSSAPEATLVTCKNITECAEKLKSGEVDAIAADDDDMTDTIKNESKIKNTGINIPESSTQQGFFVGMMKDNTALKECVDKTIDKNLENKNLETWIMSAWNLAVELGVVDDNTEDE